MNSIQFAAGPGFQPPSTSDFNLPPAFGHSLYATKPIFLVFFSVILISAFFIASSRKAAVVPSKMQFAGEMIYGFVRNNIGAHQRAKLSAGSQLSLGGESGLWGTLKP